MAKKKNKKKVNKKSEVKEINISKIPNSFHFDIQRSTRMQIIENKKHYKRRPKHKRQECDE